MKPHTRAETVSSLTNTVINHECTVINVMIMLFRCASLYNTVPYTSLWCELMCVRLYSRARFPFLYYTLCTRNLYFYRFSLIAQSFARADYLRYKIETERG